MIGLTTAVATTDGAQGLGFATPIDIAHSTAQQLITSGKVTHVWMGVEGADVDPATANALHLEGGALVGDVVKGSPADRAGLVARDVIVGIDGHSIGTMGALVVALRGRKPGDVVAFDIMHGKEQKRVSITLAERPPNL